jgi:hypothetical protein
MHIRYFYKTAEKKKYIYISIMYIKKNMICIKIYLLKNIFGKAPSAYSFIMLIAFIINIAFINKKAKSKNNIDTKRHKHWNIKNNANMGKMQKKILRYYFYILFLYNNHKKLEIGK